MAAWRCHSEPKAKNLAEQQPSESTGWQPHPDVSYRDGDGRTATPSTPPNQAPLGTDTPQN
ncbi:MAG: hypothetical protein JXN61_11910, partial [Sedimentisphaerales bacterium]|nr:hypothetical protein [Sedimentisphaerales bacterium]